MASDKTALVDLIQGITIFDHRSIGFELKKMKKKLNSMEVQRLASGALKTFIYLFFFPPVPDVCVCLGRKVLSQKQCAP